MQTINGVLMLWEELKFEQEYLITAHLNQDPLENQFSIVRNNRGSYEKNPSALRFSNNLSLCVFQHIPAPQTSGYDVSDAVNLLHSTILPISITDEEEDIPTIEIEEMLFEQSKTILSVPDIAEDESEDENGEEENDDTEMKDKNKIIIESLTEIEDKNKLIESVSVAERMEMCSIGYLSGFVAHRIKKFKCSTCAEYSSTTIEPNEKDRPTTSLIHFRAFKCSEDNTLLFGHISLYHRKHLKMISLCY